jgi:5'-deoxynucleotidase YfbR-like HD superfamily hydrolase
MNLDIKQLLCGCPSRLRYVQRFSTCRVRHHESVAEHCFFAGLHAVVIAEWAQANTNVEIDFRVLMRRILLHDLEEARSGDFPRPFKYSTEKLREALSDAGETACKYVIADFIRDPEWQAEFFASWRHAKHNDNEGAIVEFADYLSVLSFFTQEEQDGSSTLFEHLGEMRQYEARFLGPRYNFIRPLVEQASRLSREVFHVRSRV